MSRSGPTRREFVSTASWAVTGAMLGTRRLAAQYHADVPDIGARHFSAPATSRLSAQTFLPERFAPPPLQQLALSAVDAATRAGAQYADIRFGDRHLLWLDGLQPNVDLTSTVTYGIRTLVDGAWGFVHGSLPTVDAVTTAARNAVAMARGYVPLVQRRVELAPAPVATGEWATPIQDDPFAIPLRDHAAVIWAYLNIRDRVRQAADHTLPASFQWAKETRVVASSDGTLTTQTLRGLTPSMKGIVNAQVMGYVTLRFPQFHAMAGGFELVADPTRHEAAYLTLLEEAARYLMLPKRTLEVGRYPIVVDGSTVGMLLGNSLGPALELDRVLGEEADASGTSYLGPPLEMLGSQIANPKLTVMATRAMPTPSAVKWDDEGVEPHDYRVISDGRLVDYHTSRWTAPALRPWYERHDLPPRSHGSAVATDAAEPLAVRAPHLRITPSATSASLAALCREVKEGILLVGLQECAIDQQFASASIASSREGPEIGVLLKIESGKIVSRLVGNGLDMVTRRLWNEQLVALGDASTVQQTDFEVRKGMPWRRAVQSTEAPAALFKDVNVVTYQKTL